MSLRDETDSFHCSQYTASFEFIIFECTIGVDQGYHVLSGSSRFYPVYKISGFNYMH